MKTLVVYDSVFGNTEKVARALASGMLERGKSIAFERTVEIGTLGNYDMIVIGGPTHKVGLSETMKNVYEATQRSKRQK